MNAIYFKGDWDRKFPVEDTKKMPFHLNEKESKEIDFMTLKAYFQLSAIDGAKVVEIPYKVRESEFYLPVNFPQVNSLIK